MPKPTEAEIEQRQKKWKLQHFTIKRQQEHHIPMCNSFRGQIFPPCLSALMHIHENLVVFSLLWSHSKMFDIELCPLPFSMEEMFGFISCRFSGYPASVQEQALLWLHVRTQYTQTHLSVPFTSRGSVHRACELNRLSQSGRDREWALLNMDLGHRVRPRQAGGILSVIPYALTAFCPVYMDQFQVFCHNCDQVMASIPSQ